MDAYFKFANLGGNAQEIREVFHFSWRNQNGETGDYGINHGPASDTFLTLINTTFMFQDNPDFVIECRAYMMSQDQMDFLHEQDLDNLKFLNGVIPTGKPLYELDLSYFKSKEAALEVLKDMLPD